MKGDFKFKNLQGLRAVAVLAVITFHFGLPLKGGFLGVDLFFLISGFIIPWTLFKEYDSSRAINLKSFYRRRIHRLFPASILTIFFVLLIGFLISTPEIGLVTAKSSISSLLISSNFLFASMGNNYFSPLAELNPLLHFWSLAVEEQVYLLVALLLLLVQTIILRRGFLHRIFQVLSVGCVIFSLFLWLKPQSYQVESPILFNYYSTVVRIWEFAFGFIVLLIYRKKGPRGEKPKAILDSILFIFCLYLVFATLGNSKVTNIQTFIFLIASSYFLYPTVYDSWTNRILSSRILQYIGDRSYSLYLIHWPVFVYTKSLGFGGKRLIALSILLTALISFAMYRVFESKFRIVTRKNLAAIVIGFLITLLFSIASVAITNHRVDTYQTSLAKSEKYVGDIGHEDFFKYLSLKMYPCLPESIRHTEFYEGSLRCWQSKPSQKQDIALFGDSHAEHLLAGFAEAFPNLNVVYYLTLGVPSDGPPQSRQIVDYINSNQDIKFVVLSAYWGNRVIDIPNLRKIVAGFHLTGKYVYLTSDVPAFKGDPFNCKYGSRLVSFLTNPCNSSFANQPQITQDVREKLHKAISGIPKAEVINTTQPFCSEGLIRCSMVKNGNIFYRDQNHLNIPGSIFLINSLVKNGELRNLK